MASPSTSANVYDSLGDGLMAAGDPAAAAAQYEIAVRRAEAIAHPALAVYRTNLEAARKQLSEKQR
ncbi:MAG TPA: hypothetical protein VK939_00560 [Longimicrobiales bacterium]|nr:hypothetical protein [Longimicrobiales bacterium]